MAPAKEIGYPISVKFETFVFDALPRARAVVAMEVRREDEFGPIKNAEEIDSAVTCRRLLSNRVARWLEAAGVNVPRDAEGNAVPAIEIAPGYALDADELRGRIPPGLVVRDELVLG